MSCWSQLRHHEPHVESQSPFWPVNYFTCVPTQEQLQLIRQNMQLIPADEPPPLLQYCLECEQGSATVQQLYTRPEPIITHCYDRSAVGFTPHLALLSDSRCIHLTEHCLTDPQQAATSPYPQLAVPPYLSSASRGALSADGTAGSTGCAECRAVGARYRAHMAPFAMICTFITAVSLFAVDSLRKNIRRIPTVKG